MALLVQEWHNSNMFAGLQLRVYTVSKIIFLFLNQTYVVGLKKTVSMRRFFWAPKTYAKTDG